MKTPHYGRKPPKTASLPSSLAGDAVRTLSPKQHARNAELEYHALFLSGRISPPMRRIVSREDLSFTVRDSQDRLVNWYVPPEARTRYWGNGCEVGAAWFEEVKQLAHIDPEEAVFALQFAWHTMNQRAPGEESGFMKAFAQAAVAGILAYPQGIPEIPKRKRKHWKARLAATAAATRSK